MKIVFQLVLLFFFHSALTQELSVDSLYSKKQNDLWIEQFENLNSKTDQIEEIKKKITLDSKYSKQCRSEQIKCRLIIKSNETFTETLDKSNCECKILFILHLKDRFYVLEPDENQSRIANVELATEKNIDDIKVLKGVEAMALYGYRARCGVVIMESNNQELLQ